MENTFLRPAASVVLSDYFVFKSSKRCPVQLNSHRICCELPARASTSLKSNAGVSRSKRRNRALPVVAQPEAVETISADEQFQLKDAAAALEETFKQASSTSSTYGPRIVKSSRSRRLNLRKRVVLKEEITTAKLGESGNRGSVLLRSPVEDIWSDEADSLIRASYESQPINWRHLSYPVLSQQEESGLIQLLKPMKALLKFKAELKNVLGREPSDEEWAEVCNIDLKVLQRRMQLGRAAQVKLIQHNSRFVLFLAKKYQREAGSFTLEDLCQEGVKGVLEALDHFNPGKGARFSTYAVYWIRTTMLRAITRTGYFVRLPFSHTIKRLKIKKAAQELRMELGRYPSHEEIMQRVGMDANEYWSVREMIKVRSLDATVRGTNETLQEYLPDEVDDSSEMLEDLESLMEAVLKPKEQMVLKHRYFVAGREKRSLREVGQRMNLSPEMVRRYEASALKKLRNVRRVA